MRYSVHGLTEEGKEIFSWQFDETVDLDDLRAVTDHITGEVIIAIRIPKYKLDTIKCATKKPFNTEKGKWLLVTDNYGVNYVIRMGNRDE